MGVGEAAFNVLMLGLIVSTDGIKTRNFYVGLVKKAAVGSANLIIETSLEGIL